MRLTNVAQMTLPPGRVRSYALRVTETAGERLPVSFDQGRHVGGGDRPGSWMSIAFRIPLGTTLADTATAWEAVVRRHGTLRTVFTRGEDGDELVLTEVGFDGGAWDEHPVPDGAETRDVVRAVFDAECRPFSQPSHRLLVVEPGADAVDARPAVVIGSDHAHVDMWSLLVIVHDLMLCLDDVHAGREPGAGLEPVEAFAVHTALLEQRDPAPDEIARRWAEILDAEGGTMPLFPLPLGDLSEMRPAAVEVWDVLSAEEMQRFTAHAGDRGVGAAALAMSLLTRVTRDLADAPLRAVFPVHSRFERRWHDAVGWFITNSVIECRDADPTACASALRQAMALGSHPLAPILEPYGGMPGVSSVIESDDVMVWFIVNEDGLHLRFRCPDTADARESVGRWVNEVTAAIRAHAASPVPAASA